MGTQVIFNKILKYFEKINEIKGVFMHTFW